MPASARTKIRRAHGQPARPKTGRTGHVNGARKQASIGQNSHRLYRGIDPSQRDRHTILPVNQDTRHSVDCYTHDRMTRFGRLLYSNVGFVSGAMEDIATYAVGDRWQPMFLGTDAAWGELAAAQLMNWGSICDVRGQPFNWNVDLGLAVVSMLRDGDVLMVLAASPGGYPQLQFIPSHRLGSRGQTKLDTGPYRGLTCHNGVIFNSVGRAVAFQILGDAPDADQFVSARDACIIFNPHWVDQARGMTSLASVINDHVDIDDITSYEKFAAKLFASQTLVETTGDDPIGDDAERFTEDQGADSAQLWEDFEGGMVRKYRANSGADLKAFEQQRPSPNLMAFRRELMRGTYAALQWPIEFAYDPSTITSGAVRMVLGRANRTIERVQGSIRPAALKAATWAIARFMSLGLLPFNPEWYRWAFQMPRKVTVDNGREAQQAREDFKSRLSTAQRIYGEVGDGWKEEFDQSFEEDRYVLRNLKAIAEAEGCTLAEVVSVRTGAPAKAEASDDPSAPPDKSDKKKKEEDDEDDE